VHVRTLSTIAIVVVIVVVITTSTSYGCSCGSGNSVLGKGAWDVAKMRADSAEAIFEGRVERLDFRWIILDAPQGSLVPVLRYDPADSSYPRTMVKFQVVRVYKGQFPERVLVRTGLGGGDCGARFIPGLTYLVYGYRDNEGEFSVSMCSPGGLITSATVAPDLRYLRGERSTKSDLIRFMPHSSTARELAREQVERKRRYDAYERQLARTTGKICGSVNYQSGKRDDGGSVAFLSTAGFLVGEIPFGTVQDDGTFCSDSLTPGPYYLRFPSHRDKKVRTISYYPNVISKDKATPVEVVAGQIRRNVVLKEIPQNTYSVRGFISASEKTGLDKLTVSLFRVDGTP
jgi:hypothetical protein